MYKLSMIIIFSVSCSSVLSASDQQSSGVKQGSTESQSNARCIQMSRDQFKKWIEGRIRKENESWDIELLAHRQSDDPLRNVLACILSKETDQAVQLLQDLPKDTDIDRDVVNGRTLLHAACDTLNSRMMQKLYARGSDAFRVSKDGTRPVDLIQKILAMSVIRSKGLISLGFWDKIKGMISRYQIDYDQPFRNRGSNKSYSDCFQSITHCIVYRGIAEQKLALTAGSVSVSASDVDLTPNSVFHKSLTPKYDTMISQVWCPVLDRFPA